MALADPITLPGTPAVTLARTFTKNGTGLFSAADGSYVLEVIPVNNGKTKARTLRLRNTKTTSDPLVSTTNIRVSSLLSLTSIRPADGYSDADIVADIKRMTSLLAASSDAVLLKFVAGEN